MLCKRSLEYDSEHNFNDLITDLDNKLTNKLKENWKQLKKLSSNLIVSLFPIVIGFQSLGMRRKPTNNKNKSYIKRSGNS